MTRQASRRQAVLGLAAGLSMVFAATVLIWVNLPAPAGQTVTDVNAAAAAGLASSSPIPPGEPGGTRAPAATAAGESPAATASPVPEPAAGAPATTSAAAATPPASVPPAASVPPSAPVPAPAPGAPVRVVLPTLDVDAGVIPVGVRDDGAMEIPDDVDTVGWYRFGPAPGATTGSAVLTGHVDDVRQGRGAFAEIGDLQPGDGIQIVDDAGVTRQFTVLSREEWHKTAVPMDRLFDRGGEPRVVLLTCGGPFDRSTLHYQDNIAITAVPA